jgi:1-deoxy-D-xylulose-5-phosphate reductoisomerase
VLNAANEAAVALFLDRKIPFVKIPELIEEALNAHQNGQSVSLDELIEIDRETRRKTCERAGIYDFAL